jgi:benzoyl-CoA reductase subunit D
MTVAGIDAGARCAKLVLLKDGVVIARGTAPCGIELRATIEALLAETLKRAGMEQRELESVVATGSGAESVPYATGKVSAVRALARAAAFLLPAAHTVVDVGAEESRAVKVDGKGNVLDFALNDKCAAGAGSFIEAMSRALETKAEELGELSRQAKQAAVMNAQCVIFAESEVVSMIHRKIPSAEIARSVYEAMASRISSLLRRIGIEPELALAGGVARDIGFLDALGRSLGRPAAVLPDPEYAGALGCALSAQNERIGK